jgi:hypothetical protein
MEKVIQCSYNKEADELNISIGKPQKAISLEVGEEIYVRLHPTSKEIVGFTILHFEERSAAKEKPFSLPLRAHFTLSKITKEPSEYLIPT